MFAETDDGEKKEWLQFKRESWLRSLATHATSDAGDADDQSELVHRSLVIEHLLSAAFVLSETLGAFEAQLRRMVGAEDGITDALFKFSRPVTGAYFWCPPVASGRLDLSALGL